MKLGEIGHWINQMFLVLEIKKKKVALELLKLQEEIANTKGQTLEGGVDEFS